MLDPISPSAAEVAGAAVSPRRPAYALGDCIIIRRLIGFPIAFEKSGFADRVAGAGREFFIGTGLLMADETIDFGLVRKIEILISPSISGMA